MERIQLDNSAARAVQAYIEYENIVGGADGGKLLSPEEYEEFKKQVSSQRANRLFVYWSNSSSLECKTIGPHSKCFCGHRYKDHHTDDVKTKKVPCRTPQCKCHQFNYVPVYGSNDLKCLCKHSYTKHNPLSKRCENPACRCGEFSSTHSCSCSRHYNDHETRFYSKSERQAMGKPTDNLGGGGELYAGMGGLTDFSDLVDGIEKVEPVEYAGKRYELTGASLRAVEAPKPVRNEKPRRGELTPLELYNMPHRLGK